MWYKKMPSGALQFVVFMGVVIAILLASFVSLIHIRSLFSKQAGFTVETIKNASFGINYALQNTLPHGDTMAVNLFEQDFKTLNIHKSYWGVMEKITAVSRIKTRKFTRLALIGGYFSTAERPALYLKDNNRPLVVVGNTRIQGTAFLPEPGIKPGNISGNSYYGTSLIYGKTQRSQPRLPQLYASLTEHITTIIKGAFEIEEDRVFFPEGGKTYENSFKEHTRYVYSPEEIRLQGVTLTGNIIIYSGTRIIVDNTAALKDVVLVSPEIEVEDRTEGHFQGIATEKITIGNGCRLGYPSALVVQEGEYDLASENDNMTSGTLGAKNENHIHIGKSTEVRGFVLYLGREKENNYVPQVIVEEGSELYGEIYCNQNTELKGSVVGSVFTGNFITNQAGSIYQNHLYNARIVEEELPGEYAGLLLDTKKKGVALWLY
ncbi:hypothetical protein [Sinomicrobium weinanense]|uniref:Polymer-forming cytoskeletal protein n=1 Tax=Sinomicrobium weinanense TaxID=2842200 RepID=A0A926JNT1_9FLAO|nr:hypothetical protein [Sinomicrobium weinanense]MBC9794702.1 hypothetical protein [Sinomicrobium weinanense]MBU3124187.1 hypothetical protein [Sinomicrobium weinanense]